MNCLRHTCFVWVCRISVLRKAVDMTMQRYPYFCVQLRKEGGHYRPKAVSSFLFQVPTYGAGEVKLYFFSPDHLIDNTDIRLNDFHDFRGNILVGIVRNWCSVMTILGQLDSSVNRLE